MSRLSRPDRLHKTAGVETEAWWEHRPGDRVMTVEGIAGTVTAVEDGPSAGNEQYVVELDGGLGGGDYGPGELRSLEGTTAHKTARWVDTPESIRLSEEASMACSLVNAAMEWVEDEETQHTAAEDYPELGTILSDRPPLAHAIPVTARRHGAISVTAGVVDKVLDRYTDYIENRLRPDQKWQPGTAPSTDWCRFRDDQRCMYPKELDVEGTKEAGYAVWVPVDRGWCPRHAWDEQKACPVSEPGPNSKDPRAMVDATVPWSEGGQRGGRPGQSYRRSSLQVEADWVWKDTGKPPTAAEKIDGALAGGYITEQMANNYRIKSGLQSGTPDKTLTQKAENGISRWLYDQFAKGGPGENKMTIGPYVPWNDDPNAGAPPPWVGDDYADRIRERMGQPKAAVIHTAAFTWRDVSDAEGPFWLLDWESPNTSWHASVQGPMVEDFEYGDEAVFWSLDGKPWQGANLRQTWNYEGKLSADAADEAKREIERLITKHETEQAATVEKDDTVRSNIPNLPWDRPAPQRQWDSLTATRTFEFTAAWKDVQAKAKDIRHGGGVRIISSSPQFIVGEVTGDSNLYESTVEYVPGTKQAALWTCGCAWANYSWGRSGRWKRYEGRMCSHALALVYEAQARGMFGKEIREDAIMLRRDPTVPVVRPGDYRTKPRPFRVGQMLHEAIGKDSSDAEVAKYLVDKAKAEEPKTSRDMRRIVTQQGGEMKGLQYAVKTNVARIEEKLRDKRHRKPDADPSTLVGDILRYTMIFPELQEFPKASGNLVDWSSCVQDALFALEEAGYKIIEFEHSWPRGDPYSGTHVELVSPAKMLIELQFHTDKSFLTKDKLIHKMFEEYRGEHTPLKRKQDLYDMMAPYWDAVEIPPHALEWPGVKTYPRPKAAAMRRVRTDADLASAPVAKVAQAMLESGETPNVVLAWVTEAGADDPPAIVAQAMAMSFPTLKARVRGAIRKVLEVMSDTGKALVEGIGEVHAREVLYPTWDPRLGLDLNDRRTGMLVVAEADSSTGVMVCVRPPEHVCEALHPLGDEDFDNLHVTLAYLGKMDGVDRDKLHMITAEVADRHPALMGKVGGFGVFLNNDQNVLVAMIDSAGLEDLQVDLTDSLQRAGLPVHNDHGYQPHLTLSYKDDVPTMPKEVPADAVGPWPISHVTAVYGDEWVPMPLTSLPKAASLGWKVAAWAPSSSLGRETWENEVGDHILVASPPANAGQPWNWDVYLDGSDEPDDSGSADSAEAAKAAADAALDALLGTATKAAMLVEADAMSDAGVEADYVRSFKGRPIAEKGDKVYIYRDLSEGKSGYPTKESWSGLYLGRSGGLTGDVSFHVRGARISGAQARYREGDRKRYKEIALNNPDSGSARGPHAYVAGVMVEYVGPGFSGGREVSYYPDLNAFFMKDSRNEYLGSSECVFAGRGCYAVGSVQEGDLVTMPDGNPYSLKYEKDRNQAWAEEHSQKAAAKEATVFVCPACGSSDISIHQNVYDESDEVHCHDCGHDEALAWADSGVYTDFRTDSEKAKAASLDDHLVFEADWAGFIADEPDAFEGLEAELKDEPEPALPEATAIEEDDGIHLESRQGNARRSDVGDTYKEASAPDTTGPDPSSRSWLMEGGGKGGPSDGDIAAQARAFLAGGKTAMKSFTPAEQHELINEGEGVTASNLDKLDIEGTHYEALEAALASEDEEESVLW